MTRSTSRSLHRARLLTGAALIALPQVSPALAQSVQYGFQADGIVSGGSSNAVITHGIESGLGIQTRVDVLATTAIIEWSPINAPSGGEIGVLPQNNSLLFEGGSNFVVLNRVLPKLPNGEIRSDTPIRFDGTVESRIDGVQGGSVWFYSPGGMILGGTSVFDVGSLVLSASDIADNDVVLGQTKFGFGQALNTNAAITLEGGAQISVGSPLSNSGNYLAIVAPRIVQGGTVNVDGSIAYVAAEAADISINAGLFDINLSKGSDAANPIIHTGTTTGSATTPGPRNIVMASVPKNSAITLLLGGQIGHDTSVDVEDGAIVLSAGYEKIESQKDPTTAGPASSLAGNIELQSGIFTSRLEAYASGDLVASPDATVGIQTTTLAFQSTALLQGRTRAEVRADQDETITFAGAGEGDQLTIRSTDGTAGLYAIYTASEGSPPTAITGGAVSIDASGASALAVGTGGTAELIASGAGLDLGAVRVVADGRGLVDPDFESATGGQGGTARVRLEGGARLAADFLAVEANGIGGSASASSSTGGSGRGGSASVELLASELQLGTTLDVRADGIAGLGGNKAGDAFGGTAGITAASSMLMADSGLTVSANGSPNPFGTATIGGAGKGGSAAFTTVNTTVNTAELNVSAIGEGASGGDFFTSSGVGGAGEGGTVAVSFTGGSVEAMGTTLSASGLAGASNSVFGGGSATGGAASGGSVSLSVDGSTVSSTRFELFAHARGGDAGAGIPGAATGGSIELTSRFGGAISSGGGMALDASATAGSGDIIGASATGGTILTTLEGGSLDIQLGSLFADVSAQISRATGDTPLLAKAGTIQIDMRAGGAGDPAPALTAPAGLQLLASAREANPFGIFGPGNGATAVGGVIGIDMSAGALSTGAIQFEASGEGGAGSSGGPGGAGFAGRVSLTMSGGQLNAAGMNLRADAAGGEGADVESGYGSSFNQGPWSELSFQSFAAEAAPAAGGGTANIGTSPLDGESGVFVDISGGTLTSTAAINLSARGQGGDGGNVETFETDTAPSGHGGAAQGGIASFRARAGATINVTSIDVDADALGGDGGEITYFVAPGTSPAGSGGAATGGSAAVLIEGKVTALNNAAATADGTGGSGGTVRLFGGGTTDPAGSAGGVGGSGTGGTGVVRLSSGAPSSMQLFAGARGRGGTGGDGVIGGVGGAAAGGTSSLEFEDVTGPATYTLFASRADSAATGGDGGRGDLAGGNGGAATGGSASLIAAGDVSVTTSDGGILANARGGRGGTGGDSANPAPGGRGGDALGGTVELLAERANLTIFAGEGGVTGVNASGEGGVGGDGASGPLNAGGRGGDGKGGSVLLNAAGGTITAPFGPAFRPGPTGRGGNGGFSTVLFSTRGPSGTGEGGDLRVTASDNTEIGAIARISLGIAELSAHGINGDGSGGTGGSVSVIANGSASNGTIAFDALQLATTTLDGPGGDIDIGGNGRIVITGGLAVLSGGAANYAFDGNGGLTVGGSSVQTIARGDITFTHSNQGPSPVATFAAPEMRLQAGGDIEIGTGARLVTDRGMLVSARGDIRVAAGALLRAAADAPVETGYGATDPLQQVSMLRLIAGDTMGGVPTGDPSSIIFDGALEATDRTVLLSAEAIQGGAGSTITGANLFARVRNAPSVTASADCGQGNICLGRVVATNLVRIGETGFVPNRLSLIGGIDAKDVLLRSRDTMTLGGAGAIDFIKASNSLLIESTGGNVLIAGTLAIESAATVRLNAAGDLIGAGATLRSPGSIDLTAGGDITLAGIDAGQLRTLDAAGIVVSATGLDVAGAITFTETVKLGTGLTLRAGTGIDVAAADIESGAIDFASAGTVRLGAAGTGPLGLPDQVSLKGDTVLLGDVKSGGAITASSATALDFQKLDAAGALNLSAGNVITGGSASGASLNFTASDINAGTLTATAGDLTAGTKGTLTLLSASATGAVDLAGGDVTASGLSSGGPLTVSASGAAALGSATSAGAVDVIAAGPLTFGNITAETSLALESETGLTGGNATGATVALTSGGALKVDAVTATGGDLTVAALGDVGLAKANSTGALTIVATGAATLGTAASKQNVGIAAGGPVSFASLTSGDAVIVESGDGVSGGDAAGRSVTLIASGALTTGALTANDGDLNVSAGDAVDLASAGATGQISIGGADVKASTLSAGGAISISANGAVTLGNAGANDAIDISATGPVSFAGLSAAQAITIATQGDVAGGTASGTELLVTADGSIAADQLVATKGDIQAQAAGALTVVKADASGAMLLLAGTDLKGGSLVSGGPLSVSAGGAAVFGSATSGGTIAIGAAGPIGFDTLTTTDALAVAGNGISGVNATGASVTLTSGDGVDVTKASATAGDLEVLADGAIALESGSATGALSLVGADVAAAKLSAGGPLVVDATGSATLAAAGSGNEIRITATGPVTFETLAATGALTVDSQGDVTGGQASGTALTLAADGTASLDRLSAKDGDLTVTAAEALTVGDADASGAVRFAGKDVTAGTLVAGDTLDIAAAGPVNFTKLTAAKSLTVSGNGITGGTATGSSVALVSTGTLAIDTLSVTAGDLDASATGALALGSADATGAVRLGGTDVKAASLTSGGALTVEASGAAQLGSAVSGEAIEIAAGGQLGFTELAAAKSLTVSGDGVTGETATGTSVALVSTGALAIDTLSATAGDLDVSATAALTLGSADATGAVRLAGADVKAASLTSGGALTVKASGTAQLGSAASGEAIEIAAGGPLGFATLTASKSLTVSGDGVTGETATGTSVALVSTGALAIDTLSATAGDLDASATGALALGRADATGAMRLAGAEVKAPTLSAGGPISVTTAGAATLGNVGTGEAISIEAAGPVSFARLSAAKAVTVNGTGDVTGGEATGTDLSFTAGGTLAARSLKAAGDLKASATGLLAIDETAATGALALAGGTVKTGTASAGGPLGVTSGGAATLGTVRSDGTLNVTAGGPVSFANLSAATALELSSKGGVTGETATGKSVTLVAGGAAQIGKLTATGGDLTAMAGQLLDLGSATAAGTLRVSGAELRTPSLSASTRLVAASLGDATFATAVSADSIDLSATGTLTIADAKAVNGGASLTGGSIVIGKVEATGALKATASGLITVNSLATGSTVELTSGDIAVGSSAEIGRAAETTSVVFTSTSGRAAVGGQETAELYRLTDAELDRVASKGDITIAVAPTSALQSLVFDLQDPGGATFLVDVLSFSGARLGASGTLRFVSPGSIGVIGGARFDGMGAGQSLLLQATNDIALAGETGSLALRDASGGLAGMLRIDARQVHALSASGRAALRTAPNLAAASLRLAQQDGLASEDGFFAAGGLVARVSRAFFVQNSGTEFDVPDARRGLTVSSGGLRIESTGTTPAAVAISGRVLNASGGVVTGGAVVPATTVTGALDPASTVNGCLVNNPASCAPIKAVVSPPAEDPVPIGSALSISRDYIVEEASTTEEEEERKGEGGSSKLPQPIIEILRVPQSNYDPLIDEPVTGSGNDDLWDGAPIPAPGGPGL